MAISQQDGTVRIIARIQLKSSTFRWERSQDEIKFWITSSPTQGKANRELVKQIAQICRISTSKVNIVAGWKSRKKTIELEGMDFESVNAYFSRD
ncbi:MAG: DUF167 domain-containing protein [Candidatus Ranarchaeia archaeon]